MILYLRYIYLLEGRFKFDNYSPKHVIIDVKWQGSFSRQAFISKSLKFEICCMLYNLVLIYLQNGAYYLNTSKDATQVTTALNKFKAALWCIQMIKQYLPSIPK